MRHPTHVFCACCSGAGCEYCAEPASAPGRLWRLRAHLRHTFASNAIAAGIATFEIARVMGTSVLQIEKTYGHLLPDAIDRARQALDAWAARAAAQRGVQ